MSEAREAEIEATTLGRRLGGTRERPRTSKMVRLRPLRERNSLRGGRLHARKIDRSSAPEEGGSRRRRAHSHSVGKLSLSSRVSKSSSKSGASDGGECEREKARGAWGEQTSRKRGAADQVCWFGFETRATMGRYGRRGLSAPHKLTRSRPSKAFQARKGESANRYHQRGTKAGGDQISEATIEGERKKGEGDDQRDERPKNDTQTARKGLKTRRGVCGREGS